MDKSTKEIDFCTDVESWSLLEKIAREGAKKMLQLALENEIGEFINKHKNIKTEENKQAVVRNGYMPVRDITTGIGPIEIKQPRVDDRCLENNTSESRFSSIILPKYIRRMPSIDNLIPMLYLKGISTNDFPTALSSVLGEGVKGLSATNIVRLKKSWEQDYLNWKNRDLSQKEYDYIWVDGIHFNVRLEDERTCILVIMGADKNGNKELLAVDDGFRESKLGWKELLLRIKKQGLKSAPKLAIGDGALGFWSALDEVFPGTKRQRCWVHKTANILEKLPKKIQPKAKAMLHEIYLADTEKNAKEACDHFIKTYECKYPKATHCLIKDKADLFSFYSFPAKHWSHIRTTNPIESTFATIRLRTKKTKGMGTRQTTLTMVFKLAIEAEKTWRKLKGYKQIPLILENKIFKDGILLEEVA